MTNAPQRGGSNPLNPLPRSTYENPTLSAISKLLSAKKKFSLVAIFFNNVFSDMFVTYLSPPPPPCLRYDGYDSLGGDSNKKFNYIRVFVVRPSHCSSNQARLRTCWYEEPLYVNCTFVWTPGISTPHTFLSIVMMAYFLTPICTLSEKRAAN